MSTLTPALAALRFTVDAVAAGVKANPDPAAAHTEAELLLDELVKLVARARLLKAHQVMRMAGGGRLAGGMSLAQIGALMGVSRGRVHQIIAEAKADIAACAGSDLQEAA